MLGYRYRLSLTAEQDERLAQWVGCARVVYNAALQQRQVAWREYGVSLRYNDQGASDLTDAKRAFPWLADPHCDVLQQALRDLDRAYVNFFEGRAGPPRFRRKGAAESIRIQNRTAGKITARRLNRRWGELRVPKLGTVRFRWTRQPIGEIHHLTLTRSITGWHVSLACDGPAGTTAAPQRGAVGIDRGVSATVALSTGELHRCPGLSPGQARRLRRLARKAGRQETARRHRSADQRRRSRRHQQTLDHIAHLRARETLIRDDFLHKLTSDIAKSHGTVVIEDLRVRSMTRSARGTIEHPGVRVAQKRGLNRSILTQGWGRLEQMLTYKLAMTHSELLKVPAAYTSQTCSACGSIDPRSRISQATFRCVACGHAANADVNAAQNILAAGLAVTARGAHGEEAGAMNREPPEGLADAA